MNKLMFLAIPLLLVSCGPRTPRDIARKELQERIDQDRKATERIRALHGANATSVRKVLGDPRPTPCADGRTCWYYDLSNRTYFVCFDERENVVCEGTVAPLTRPSATVSPLRGARAY